VDALLDPDGATAGRGLEALAARLEMSLADATSYEDALNRTRLFAAEQRFRISVSLLREALTPLDAGKSFSDLAEAVVGALFGRTVAEFERQHGALAGGRAAILAFGRLGSREMTAGSDLTSLSSTIMRRRPRPPMGRGRLRLRNTTRG
jgi:glutamate-ammonia-ligase adenylyltransferase